MDCDTAHATTPPPAIVSQVPKVGGYKPVPNKDPEARVALATALKLTKTVGELEELDISNPQLVSVERQVVAGRNYRVSVWIGPRDGRHLMKVEYFQNLKGGTMIRQVYFDGEPIMGT